MVIPLLLFEWRTKVEEGHPNPALKKDVALLEKENRSFKKNTVNRFFLLEIFGWKVSYFTYFTYLPYFMNSAVCDIPFKLSFSWNILQKHFLLLFRFLQCYWLCNYHKFVVKSGHHFLKRCLHHFDQFILFDFCKNYAKQNKCKWHLVNLLN